MKDSIVYYSAVVFGKFVCILPYKVALWFGRLIGVTCYAVDFKNRTQVYANLKIAFAKTKSLQELQVITRQMYKNFGQSIIDMFRLPLLNRDNFSSLVTIKGKEHIDQARQNGRGAILLGMHAGSWEMANVTCAMLDFPYTLFANVQKRYTRLDRLLNSYRTCGGSIVLNRGHAVRDIVGALKKNEVVGMVVDQGGRRGQLIPFFGREASMSVGAIRMALKYDAPIIFSTIHRSDNGHHEMVFSEPISVEKTGDDEQDIMRVLEKVVGLMEVGIKAYPSEYMWVYKIWKYSKQAHVCILSDGKIGHQRQSEAVANVLQQVLHEKRDIATTLQIIEVKFRTKFLARLLTAVSLLYVPLFMRGKLGFLKWFLDDSCAKSIILSSADYVISCGSSMAGLNFLLSRDHNAKSIALLKPGLLSYNRFDLVVLPKHDAPANRNYRNQFAITNGAPNLINKEYLLSKTEELLSRFSHLKNRTRKTIGVFLGGTAKNVYLSEKQIKLVIRQLNEVAENLNADLLITTSRRTPVKIDHLIKNAFKRNDRCPLLIIPNEENIDAAVGGIMGLSDMLIVSGDSLSMISEAATSGKKAIVFTPEMIIRKCKHMRFIKNLSKAGYIASVDAKNIGQQVYDVSKNKVTTRPLHDNNTIYEAICEII